MKPSLKTKLYGRFYHTACKKNYQRIPVCSEKVQSRIKTEYKNVILRAKDIGDSKLLSAYCMGAYFIAVNRCTGLSAEENYQLFKDGLYNSTLLHKVMGNAEAYLNPKKLQERKRWAEESHKRKYENDWIVDILDGNGQYELGYDYHECGICKLCRDEDCFELAKYLCRLDFVLADMMGMELCRTQTIAEGADHCDFRYKRK
ncbi:MAG: L-2-amino-thiazoline-4-carboxylic acid hydrolase [Eubacterium sp.]|nr:L-2-amino-thiazoline-4-carboxylic acid hydrolase [Eubacterium sp.]